jgi:hypothetical protein
MCSRIGTRQTDLPQLSNALGNEGWESGNVYGVEETRIEYEM